MTMQTERLDRIAFLAFGAMLWACIAAVAGLIAYTKGGIVGGLIAMTGATLLVAVLALAMARSAPRT